MSYILVVGSVGYDTIATPSGRVENTLGGSANYFSVPASIFAPIKVVGVVGKDYSAKDFAIMKERDIDTTGVQIQDGETFRWSGSYVDDLNEAVTLKTELNVFRHFNPVLPATHVNASYLFLANIDPVLQMRVLDQVQSPQFIGLDTMNYWIDSKLDDLKKVLKRVDAFLLNETEALKVTQETNIVLATQKLVEMGPKIVVVKRGEYGFFMLSEGRFFVLPAMPISNVVDPTGAGDSFAGGFMGYLCRNGFKRGPGQFRMLQEACIHGSVVASFCVEDFGIEALKKLSTAKIESRMAEFRKVVTVTA
jgi:sugar/nucleoside kinase (ribokinase family)